MKTPICSICGKSVFLEHETHFSNNKNGVTWTSELVIQDHLNENHVKCLGSGTSYNNQRSLKCHHFKFM